MTIVFLVTSSDLDEPVSRVDFPRVTNGCGSLLERERPFDSRRGPLGLDERWQGLQVFGILPHE
jgi:hypothetical protein